MNFEALSDFLINPSGDESNIIKNILARKRHQNLHIN